MNVKPRAGSIISSMMNLVTGRWVRLVPAYRVPDGVDPEAAIHRLQTTFDNWCKAGWEFAQLDPEEVDISHMWPARTSRTITDIEVVDTTINGDGLTITRIRDKDTGDVIELRGTWYLGVPS